MTGARPIVLIVDDEVDISRVLAMRLAAQGYEARMAADGEAGLREARRPGVSLLLLDLNLPGISGQSLCLQLRCDAATASLPIVLLSASVEDLAQVAREVGADGHMGKPYETRALLNLIARSLSRPENGPPPGPFRVEKTLRSFFAARAIGIAKAREGLRADDWTAVRELAHSLQGCSGVEGFAVLAEHAAALRAHRERRDAAAALAVLSTLERWIEDLKRR